MTHAHRLLFDEISKLPIEKLDRALSYIRYLATEPETELLIDPEEEAELHALLTSDDFTNASGLLAKIEGLPDDKIPQTS